MGRRAMYARRFLGCIVIVTLLIVAGAFAIYQWGGRVLVEQAVPKGHFEPVTAGGGPDYTHDARCMPRRTMPDDPARWRPDGAGAEQPGKAAIFFIHPTTYLSTDRWN